MSAASIVWFRRDLRVDDNPALSAAAARGAVLPVYIHAPQEEEAWAAGAASRAWLHRSLEAVAGRLKHLGAQLHIFHGDSAGTLKRIAEEVDADAVFFNQSYEPAAVSREKKIESSLIARGDRVRSFRSALLFEPHEIQNQSGNPFRQFTPFYKFTNAVSPGSGW